MAERQLAKLVVYVLLRKEGKILLGKRKNAFGDGHYSMPAGHIEPGETVMGCAERELLEETGLKAKPGGLEFRCVSLLRPYEIQGVKADTYVAFFVEAKGWKGEPQTTEPDKNEGWEWHPLRSLPRPLFPPVAALLQCIERNVDFLD